MSYTLQVRRILSGFTAAVWVLLATWHGVPTGVAAGLVEHTTLRCAVTRVLGLKWNGREWTSERHQETMTFTLDSIDVNRGRARVLGNQGAADVGVLPATGPSLIFVELPLAGPMIQIIFDGSTNPGDYPTVLSRHLDLRGLRGSLLASHWVGRCVAPPW
jgi:hypothetical protein